jgi:hypothetical protein
MFFESEISDLDSTNDGNGKHKNYTRVVLKATEEEKNRMQD